MQKSAVVFLSGIVALLLVFMISCSPVEQPAVEGSSYAEDRALIEELQARYMFAMDFGDVDTYVSTFTEDGVLDIGDGEVRGHEAIREIMSGMPDRKEAAAAKEREELRPATGRHNITNIAIKVDGDKAVGRAYWFHYGNNNPERRAILNSYGHYEDEMVKVNGEWFFSKRRIYNEQVEKWVAPRENPCW